MIENVEVSNEELKEESKAAEENSAFLALRNPCLTNSCHHTAGPDTNKCIIDHEFTYLGAAPLPTKAIIDGEEHKGHLPIVNHPMSAQAYLYTDDTIRVNFIYMQDHDEPNISEEIEKVTLNTSLYSGSPLLSIEVSLVDFWNDDAYFVFQHILSVLKCRKNDAKTFNAHINIVAVEKILTEADNNCLYDMLCYFYEGIVYE